MLLFFFFFFFSVLETEPRDKQCETNSHYQATHVYPYLSFSSLRQRLAELSRLAWDLLYVPLRLAGVLWPALSLSVLRSE